MEEITPTQSASLALYVAHQEAKRLKVAAPFPQITAPIQRELGELEDLLTTLEKCKQLLSPIEHNTFALHLRRIEMIVKKHFGKEL